jgi:cytochrome oxidase Cu insertion factor (SCO1/SenC/PrrC family)
MTPPTDNAPETGNDVKLFIGFGVVVFFALVVALGLTTSRARRAAALAQARAAKATSTVSIASIPSTKSPTTNAPAATAKHLADFRLTERSGTAVTLADVRGKMVVVSFVFTSCGTTCLAVTKQMAEVQKQTAGQDDLRLLSITVDPKTDTPAVLTKFADRFAADPRRWLYLTGDKKPIWELLEATFLEPEDDGDVFLANPDGSPPTRTPLVRRILVFDRTGAARACFNGMDDGAATGVVQTLAALRAEETKR